MLLKKQSTKNKCCKDQHAMGVVHLCDATVFTGNQQEQQLLFMTADKLINDIYLYFLLPARSIYHFSNKDPGHIPRTAPTCFVSGKHQSHEEAILLPDFSVPRWKTHDNLRFAGTHTSWALFESHRCFGIWYEDQHADLPERNEAHLEDSLDKYTSFLSLQTKLPFATTPRLF